MSDKKGGIMIKIKGIILIILLFPSLLIAQQKLEFSYFPEGIDYLELLREAYAELNIEVVTVDVPPERALQMSNEGILDGEVVRSGEITEVFSNLLIVPVPLYQFEVVVYTIDKVFEVDGWESLRPYSMAIRRGYRTLELYTEGMDRTFVTDMRQAYMMLNAGRVDIVVNAGGDDTTIIKELGYTHIKKLSPPILTMPLYHLLHKKHYYLIKRITPILQRMVDEGRFDAIPEKYER